MSTAAADSSYQTSVATSYSTVTSLGNYRSLLSIFTTYYSFYSLVGGGGGAPLKDVTGGTVTNLRSVIRGSVEVNHNLPSGGSPSKWKGVHHDDSDSHDSGRSDSYDSEEDRRRSRNRRNQDDRRGRSRSTDRNDRRNDERRRVHTPEIPGLTINTSPKKGLGSALKDMNASESVSEKEFRNRKEVEYQNQLRQQIEEKRKMKEAENKKIALTKHKELEEYYFTFYKGNVPSHVKKELKQAARKLRGDEDDEVDGDNDYFRSDDRKSSERRERSKNSENYDEPLRTSRSEKSRPERSERTRSTSRGRNKDSYDSDQDVPDKRKSSRSGDQGWVSQTEYDELSALCEKLLQQQKNLQIEIKNQAKVINELQKQSSASIKGTVFNRQGGRGNAVDSDNVSVGSKSVRSKSAVARARVVDPKASKNVAVQQPKAPTGERRPSSTHSLGSRSRAVSKDRFGNKIEPKEAPTKLKNLRVNGQNSPEKAPPLKLKGINFSNDDEPPSNVRNGGSTGNGFQKLAAMRSGGPIVVVHDENMDYNERNVQPTKSALKKSHAGANSIELNGNSEMLRIGGEEVDMISGDQLDRLLVQAKKARAPAGPTYNRFANLD